MPSKTITQIKRTGLYLEGRTLKGFNKKNNITCKRTIRSGHSVREEETQAKTKSLVILAVPNTVTKENSSKHRYYRAISTLRSFVDNIELNALWRTYLEAYSSSFA